MDIKKSIDTTKKEFERSFAENNYYNLQTQDDQHLELILDSLSIKNEYRILDLGTGSGYLAFPIALKYPKCNIVGLDIVEKTLSLNAKKAQENRLSNLRFESYDGLKLPFDDESIDVIVTRYVLHHFPVIDFAFQEIVRVLKKGGQLFISDPTRNDEDVVGFVDNYMKMKPDGHIKFYSEDEFVELARSVGFNLENSYKTEIRFPRKVDEGYKLLISKVDERIVEGYQIKIFNNEIYIKEQVLNLSFVKN